MASRYERTTDHPGSRPLGAERPRRRALAACGALVALVGGTAAAPAAASGGSRSAGAGLYIVRSSSVGGAAAAVRAAGGAVTLSLPIVEGVEATLSTDQASRLGADRSVTVVPDTALRTVGQTYPSSGAAPQLARMDLGADWSPAAGAGVGVALIDTGVDASPGLNPADVVRSPDFSRSGSTQDGYGHGTFMAGLIAGDGGGGAPAVPGVAPGVTLVSVKVAGADGSTTLGQVLEGIGWAVQHRRRYNIRVMSISLGADLPVPPRDNPLDAAVSAAWASGITVVAAAGNNGSSGVTSPGDDPQVITVGAETTTGPVSVPSWSGVSTTKPDVLAPGVSVTSLRAPGSTVDLAHPSARVGQDYFRGSGTSMATALTAGAAAVLISRHPLASPDEVKAALLAGAGPAPSGPAGTVDVLRADAATAAPVPRQALPGAGHWAANQTMSRDTMYWDTMSWDTMSWDTMSWDTMSWDTMSWDTMSWDDRNWG